MDIKDKIKAARHKYDSEKQHADFDTALRRMEEELANKVSQPAEDLEKFPAENFIETLENDNFTGFSDFNDDSQGTIDKIEEIRAKYNLPKYRPETEEPHTVVMKEDGILDSVVDGLSSDTLDALKAESSSEFKRGGKHSVEKALTSEATITTDDKGTRTLRIEFGKSLFAAEVGATGLIRDIEKSLKDSSRGIRDFYNIAYDRESGIKVREKENYLNLPLTGDPQQALSKLSEYAKNKFNSTSLNTINDATHTNMMRTHERERKAEPNNVILGKRHAAEFNLWTYREQSQLNPDVQQDRENFKKLMRTHEEFKMEKSGKTLSPSRRPEPDTEHRNFLAMPPPRTIITDTLAQKIANARTSTID